MSKKPEENGQNAAAANSDFGSAKPFLVMTLLFSLVVNLLMLVSPLYMLQVYDRVLSSGSVETLIMVSIVAIGLLSIYGFAESARRKVLAIFSEKIHEDYGPTIFKLSFQDQNASRALPKNLADLSTVQNFLRHGLLLPFFDLPFTPLFIFAMFLVHPIIGWIGVIGGIALIAITIITELTSRSSVDEALKSENSTRIYSTEISRKRSIITSLGMMDPLLSRWMKHKQKSSDMTLQDLGRTTFFSSQAKGLRQMLQIAALGIGGYLVLQLEMSAGAIIAGSILMGRALAPIDQAVSAWRQMIRARKAWSSIQAMTGTARDPSPVVTPMPRPAAELSIEGLTIAVPNTDLPLLPKFNVKVTGGSVVAILGPSGSGKTSLLQTLVGAYMPHDGHVRLGGRDVHAWEARDRGQYVGYAPQNIELLPGTIAENICRFSDAPSEQIMAAAQKAGFHDAILRLPDGYDTIVGIGGTHLSQGQRKGVGLSRAVFGNPVLLVLDEPGSNLDQLSLINFQRCLAEAKSAGSIILFATHDIRFLNLADNVILLDNRSLKMASAKDYLETLSRVRSSNPNSSSGTA